MREPKLVLSPGPYSGNPLLLLLNYPLLDLGRIPTVDVFVCMFSDEQPRARSVIRSLYIRRKVLPIPCRRVVWRPMYVNTTPDQVPFFALVDW